LFHLTTVQSASFSNHSKAIASMLTANADMELDILESHHDFESALSTSSSMSSSTTESDGVDRLKQINSEKGAKLRERKISLSNQSHDTVATLLDEDDISSEGNDSDDSSCGSNDDVDDDKAVVSLFGGKQQEKFGVESKSLVSISSKSLSSTMAPASSKSITSQSSTTSTSTGMPERTEKEYKALHEQLTRKLEQERALLRQQQHLILELESLEQLISKTECDERIARLAIQQARVIRLIQNRGEERDCDLITIQVPS
jgi:hypothetical protein